MATQPLAGINAAWSLYRQCAASSAFHKSRLESLTKISLWLGIAGAVIATASSVLPPGPSSIAVSKVLATIGSICVALAGVTAAQAVAGNRDKIWVQCRGLGEALKSSVYMFCAGVPPFADANRAVILSQRVEKALKDMSGLELRADDGKSGPGPLTIDDYIKVRVDDQAAWYTQKAAEFQKKADFWRICSFAGAAVGAVMGVVSTLYSLSPWVALLATATASITAYVKNQRYASMIGLYQATAIRLKALKDEWMDSGKTDADKAERASFIERCEQTMSLENGAWTAQWSQQPDSPQAVAAKTP
jgi:hypothetical protein